MARKIEIDSGSGFCFGVTAAIRKAEEELEKSGTLFCLGDIVHNADEVERLRLKGLKTITHADLENLHDVKVLLRAHGEPPETYEIARRNNIEIIDATCPVVLQLQKRVKSAYTEGEKNGASPLILIYGKLGHAEVNGLVGQTRGEALVIQDLEALKDLDIDRDIVLFSQTTKSLDGFHEIVSFIRQHQKKGSFRYFDTICRQVSSRLSKIREFAATHEVVLFVSGAKSSNGKVLYQACREVNPRTYLITDVSRLDPAMVSDASSVGVCGATSTPRWLMQKVADSLAALSSAGSSEVVPESSEPAEVPEPAACCSFVKGLPKDKGFSASDEFFMREALKEAEEAARKGEVPVGAVVVVNGRIIARAHNMTETLRDVTAHAEILAITAAQNALGGKNLPDCTLYVTLEPCAMCAGAIGWARLKRVVWGADDIKGGVRTFYRPERHPFHPKTVLESGLLAEESAALLTSFFRARRR